MSKGQTLPHDIITDILSRLPIRSLCRFKCVSPSWKSLISDPYFAKTHLNRAMAKNSKYPEQNLVIILSYGSLNSVDYNNVNPTFTKLDFPMVEQHNAGHWVRVLSSCNGLLLVSRDESLFLLNPSTRECKKLPTCRFAQYYLSISGLGYDSSTDDYKVLMLAYIQDVEAIAAVYQYSLKSNAWRKTEDPEYPFLNQNNASCAYLVRNSGGVFYNGCLHYIGRKNTAGSSRVIIAFYLSGQFCREMPLPTSFLGSRLMVFGGFLCLGHAAGSEVWMMKEYGAIESWTKFKLYSDCRRYVVDMLAEDEFLLVETNEVTKLVVYNSQNFTKTKRDIVICGIPPFSFSFEGTYVESLVSPFHGGGVGLQ